MLKATTKTYLFWAARQCQTLVHQNAGLNIEVSEVENTSTIPWQNDYKTVSVNI